MKRKAFYILGVLIVLSPLGLISDADAWGEWGNEYYQKILGFIPEGIKNAKGIKALMSDYSLSGTNDVVGYYASAIVGIAILFGIYFILAKTLKDEKSIL
ncbi:MAG: hypothetical protein GXO12_01880 [Epsilonproteobacteria bacterium]|nr:hypothetical protein [Campylobacterota bacterium]